MKHRLALVVAIVVLASTAAFCDDECLSLLTPNVTYLENEHHENLAFLKTIDSQRFNEIKKKRSFGFDLPIGGTPLGAFADFESFRQARDRYFSEIDFRLTRDESLRYLSLYVPDDAREAYVECHQRNPFSLHVAARHGSIVIFEVGYHPDWGGAPNTLRLDWESSDKALARTLNKEKKTVRRSGKTIVNYDSFDRKKDFSLTVSARGEGKSDHVLIPAEPRIKPSPTLPWWSRERYSVPLTVTMHIAQRSNKCASVNLWEKGVDSECPRADNGWSPYWKTAHVQEVTVDFDRLAMSSWPDRLTPEQLSFTYTCTYVASRGFRPVKKQYGPVGPGETCGEEYSKELGGEPRLIGFSMQLNGSASRDFSLNYGCNLEGIGVVGPPEPGAECAGGPISGLKLEVDSIPRP